jgi:hypothetical protein
MPPLRVMNRSRGSESGLYAAAYRMTRHHLLRVRLSALAGSAVHRMMAANGSSRSDTANRCKRNARRARSISRPSPDCTHSPPLRSAPGRGGDADSRGPHAIPLCPHRREPLSRVWPALSQKRSGPRRANELDELPCGFGPLRGRATMRRPKSAATGQNRRRYRARRLVLLPNRPHWCPVNL